MEEVKLTKKALKDRSQLSEIQWSEIKSKIREISTKFAHKDLKLISNPQLKHPVWQLSVEEDKTNHRVYLDVKNNKIIVIAIWGFEFTHHGDQHWTELENRM